MISNPARVMKLSWFSCNNLYFYSITLLSIIVGKVAKRFCFFTLSISTPFMTYFTFSNFQNDYFQEVASFNFGEKEITEAYQIKFHTLKRMKPELDFHKKKHPQ